MQRKMMRTQHTDSYCLESGERIETHLNVAGSVKQLTFMLVMLSEYLQNLGLARRD